MKKIFLFITAFLLIASSAWAIPPFPPIWRAQGGYEAETTAQIARIVADGGVVIDATYMNNVIHAMKAQSIYTSAKFIGDANMGVKKDGSGAVSKLYDVSGNNNDALQPTGAHQPVWTAAQQNGKAAIATSGTTFLVSNNFAISQPMALIVSLSQTVWATGTIILDGFSLNTMVVNQWTPTPNIRIANANGSLVTAPISLTIGQFGILSCLWSGNNSEIRLNGGTPAIGNLATSAGGGIALGAAGSGSYGQAIRFGAVSLFSVSLTTAQRQAMESVINTYYAIY